MRGTKVVSGAEIPSGVVGSAFPRTSEPEVCQIVRGAWASIVGADLAAHSSPMEIMGDSIMIATESSQWTQQLAFLCDQVLQQVAALTNTSTIKQVRFRVGRFMPPGGSLK